MDAEIRTYRQQEGIQIFCTRNNGDVVVPAFLSPFFWDKTTIFCFFHLRIDITRGIDKRNKKKQSQ